MSRRRGGEVHVLHVVRTLGPGGMERNLRRVAIALESRGLRHSVLLLHDQRDILEFPSSIPVHRLVSPPHDPRLPVAMAELLLRLRPTVIHVRNAGAWADTAAARLLARPMHPLIFSYHGMDGSTVSPRERLKFQLLDKVTTRIFAVSFAARGVLVEKYGLAPERVGVILNGVDLARFAPRTARSSDGRSPGRLVVGAVGRFFAVKNFPLLLRAFRRVLDAGIDAELRLAGDGPDFAEVLRLGEDLALGPRLVCVGVVEDVPSFLHDLDVFALSSNSEANPNALLEAMAAGLACVSTAVGGAREVLEDGRHGLMVQAGDEEGFAGALLRLLNDPGERVRFGRSARLQAEHRYGERRMFDAYEALYRAPREAPLG